MKKFFLAILIMLAANGQCFAEQITIQLEKAPINIRDIDSIKRGAKFFSTVCMACHTLIYLRYDKLAEEQGVKYERMPIKVANWPFGIKPPDLSLEVSVRGADWIYTYLHSFYVDPARPTGFNNLLVPNTAMTGIIAPFQGRQVRATDTKLTQGIYDHQYQWYDLVETQQQGSMTPQQFDTLVTDIVNFLNYAAQPYQEKQENIGRWVIAFLLVLFVLVYLLKKEYWKDLKKERN